jgi:endonuclease/exonuclease/phosphatase family metal-dependent hydrolase
MRLRVASYNVHKCQGFDRKVLPQRIATVLQEIAADMVCLQEVVNAPNGVGPWNQAEEIAEAFPGWAWCFGANRELFGGTYGNMTLSRVPLQRWANHDITQPGHERRGVLETEICVGAAQRLRVFNVHLGTGHRERRYQAGRLMDEVLASAEGQGPRVVLGDFNEWTSGLTTKLLKEAFESVEPRHVLGHRRTFPGMLPLLSLDHCYYEAPLDLEETELWRSRTALVASDHLPLVATFRLGVGRAQGGA